MAKLTKVMAYYDVAPAGLNVPLSVQVQAAVSAAAPPPVTPTPAPTPAPTPTPPAVPKPPARTVSGQIMKTSGPAAVLHDLVIDASKTGYTGNNITLQNLPSASLKNVVSVNAWDASANPAPYQGSGLYVDKCPGGVTLTACALMFNGRPIPLGLPYGTTPTEYRHGGYFDIGAGAITATDCIFAGNAGDGAEVRPDAVHTFTRCVFIDNGIGLQAIMGRVNLIDCMILGAHYVWYGSSWAGLAAIVNNGQVGLTGTAIVGVKGMDAVPNSTIHPGTQNNTTPAGALVSGGTWKNTGEIWVPPPAGQPLVFTSGTNVIQGWAGPEYAGESPYGGAGIDHYGNPIVYDWSTLLAGIIADPATDIAAVAAKIQTDVRALIGK